MYRGVMVKQEQIAVRNAGLLLAQRGSHILTGLLFAFLVPRLMGPETFGRYALITSIFIWFALVSGISSAQTMSRFVPQFVVKDDQEGLQKFLGNLLMLRLANGAVAAALYILATSFWFPELDLLTLAMVAVTIFIRSWAKLLFAIFLGLNQAARWAMGETVNRWVSLAFIIFGFYLGGLRGACLGLLLTELTVLFIGAVWAWPYISWSKLGLDRNYLAPYLRYSLSFYGSNVLWSLSQHSGEIIVRVVSSDYKEVGYYGVAYRVYFTLAVTIWQLTIAFGPLMTTMLAEERVEDLKALVESLLKWMATGGVFLIFFVILLGDDLVPLAFGGDYKPAAANLTLLILALLAYGLGCVARLLALTYDRPGVATRAALINLAGFLGFGLLLVSWRGSLGACIAVLVSSALYAGYFTWSMRKALTYSLRNWTQIILIGVLFLPLALLQSSWWINVILFVIFATLYISALFMLRIVTSSEIAGIRRALKPKVATTKA